MTRIVIPQSTCFKTPFAQWASRLRGYALIARLLVLSAIAASFFALGTGLVSCVTAPSAPILTVGKYRLVAIRHARGLLFDYTYKASVTNSGTTAAADVTATIKTAPTNVTLIDGSLSFGDVAAGASVRSRDTFTIRKRIFAPFNPNNLVWTIGKHQNLVPTAEAGPDQTVALNKTAQFDGSASSDPDGDPLTYQWTLSTKPAGSAATLSDPTTVNPTLIVDKPGIYVASLTVKDGALTSPPDTVTITTAANSAPVAEAGIDQTVTAGTEVILDGRGSNDADGDHLSYRWAILSAPTGSTAALDDTAIAQPRFTPTIAGLYVVQLMVNDGKVDSDPDTVTITVTEALVVVPDVVGLSRAAAEAAITGANLVLGTVTEERSDTVPAGQVIRQNPSSGTEVTRGSAVDLVVSLGDLPPDPSTVAPPVESGVATSLSQSTEFLYTGPDPIQTGVAPGTIDPARAAVLRGRVLDKNNQPLPGVTITVLNHPEFGQTLSRADGRFDMAVNGGGLLTGNYRKGGFLPAQRQVNALWQDYALLPDVVMLELDPQVSTIDLATATEIQVARGSLVTDADGTRQGTVLFAPGTQAQMVMPDGTTQPLSTLHVRATEHTVGPNGPQAMPAELPPTSAYTYAVELSVDEARGAGAVEVRFNQPVPFYVENFLGFPVGIGVPLGSYDAARGVWVPADSGRVINVLSITGGLADLDIDGDGLADGGAALAALAITDAERQQLAGLYPPGQSLWRVRIPHFTPGDLNWPFRLPDDAEPPPAEGPEPDEPLDSDKTCKAVGSVIECQNQILGEALGVVGTRFGLHYQSERVPGRKVAYDLEIPLSGGQVPASLRQIELEISVAGRLFRQAFGPEPNQRTTFTWDGRNAYGQVLQGRQPITARIGYTYGGVYGVTSGFGLPGPILVTGVQSRREITLWRSWRSQVGGWDARGNSLGGWTLSPQHSYDPVDQVLYRGDGLRQSARAIGPTIGTVAGTGMAVSGCHPGDGGPATQADVCPQGLAVGPDGSLYIASPLANRVRRVGPDGIITTVAGTGFACTSTSGPCGDGGPATQAQLGAPFAIAVGPNNSLYIGEAAASHRVVRKVGPDGIITTFAGTGVPGYSGDGGPATLAQFGSVASLTVGGDNSVYIADSSNRRIRRVGTDGIITTAAGTGVSGFSGDGGPATLAMLGDPRGVAVGQDGSIYIADTNAQRVRRVTPDGIIRTIAGSGALGFSGDGGPATEARVSSPHAVAVGQDDTVYVVDQGNNRVRWLRPDGMINTLAGTDDFGTSGDGGPARQAALQNLELGLAVGPDGSIYVSQTANNLRVRRILPIAERLRAGGAGGLAVPAADGSEIYLFTASGRHVRTLDALTGAMRYEFAYDSGGRLATITDGDANITTVDRDGAGVPTAIVGPFGQRTTLAVNPDGYLNRITSPAGEAVQLAYTADGLLTGLTNPRGQVSAYAFDPEGRLIRATDPTGAAKTLSRVGTNKDYTVTLTSDLDRPTRYRVEELATGDQRLTTTDPAGKQTQAVIGKDGKQTATDPDGTTANVVLGPDPRWGMQAPLATSVTVTTPGGRVQTTTTQRTATLANPGDPLSLRTISETVTINGRAFTTAYDATSRTLTHTSPTRRQTHTILDNLGRPIQEEVVGLEPSSYMYDARGRLETATQGAGAASRTTTLSYGGAGFLDSITDAIGRAVAFTTDAAGRITEQALPDGGLARFAYDANGNVTALTPPGRPDYTFTYTTRDQVSVYAAPTVGAENNQTGYIYDPDRQPARVDRPDGQSVGFRYDSAGRLDLLDLASDDRSYGYDAAGRLSTLSTPTIALAYVYDGGLSTGTTWSGAVAGSVTRSYDNNFRVTSRSVNGSNPIAVQYDQDGLPTQVGDLTLTRDAQTGLITATTLGALSDSVSYDGLGAPISYTASHSGSPVYSAGYTRDLLGRISQKTETLGGTTRVFDYTYDLAGRLSEVRQDGALVASYTYDTNGNRLSRTDAGGTIDATYDAQDRLGQYGTATYAHNPNGERQTKTTGAFITSYQYDGLGNLIGVILPGETQIEYLLDGQERRIGKKVDGTLVQGFLYQDGLKPIAELDGNNNVVSRFIYSDGINVPAYMIKAGVTYRIVNDHLGSPRLVVDAATGSIAQRMDYDEFGGVTLDTNAGFQPFGFAGGLYDKDTKLTQYGLRHYDAETGRWTTKDPGGFSGGPNLYAYADNDPVNLIDPLGDNPRKGYPPGGYPRNAYVERSLKAMKTPYTPAIPPSPPTPPPVRPPLPTPPPTPLPSGGPIGRVAPYPVYQVPVAPPGTGTYIARPSFLRCTGRFGLQAVLTTLSFEAGYAIGTWLNETFDLSDKGSDFLAPHVKAALTLASDAVQLWTPRPELAVPNVEFPASSGSRYYWY